MTKPQPPQEQWTPITPVPDDAPPPYPTHFKFGRPTMRWTYRDANGKRLMYVDRFDPASEDKQFLPLTFCIDSEGNRKWRWKSLPDPRPLFGLEKLTKADPSTPVIVVEGEKCATALRSLGFVAVTSQNGSAAVNKTDWAPLSGRKTVVVFPDNDNSGEKYARAVFQALKVLNNPPDALLAHLPNLPDKGDVIDWLQAQLRSWDGYASITGPDRQRLQRLLWEAIKGCAVKPPKQWIGKTGIRDSVKEQQEWKNAKGHAQSSAVIVCAADVKPEKIQWHWPGRIALGKVSILVGDPGLGKSLVTIAMAAHTSLGNAWPVDHSPCPIGDVILLSGEDDIADTIRPRLDAAGADVKRVHILKMVQEVNPETGELVSRGFSLSRDINVLESVLDDHPETKLVVIDPITAYLDGTDSHKNAEVRGLLVPVAELAARRKVAFVAVSHLNKSGHSNAMYRTSGSLAFVAAARAVLLVTKDKDDPTRRLVLPVKNNLTADIGGVAYSIMEANNGAPMLAWEKDPVTITADDALVTEAEDMRSEREEAVEWLKAELASGSLDAEKVRRKAEKDGHAWRTVRRAKDALGIKPQKSSFSGSWQWSLPPKVSKYPQDVQPPDVDTLGKVGHLGRETGDVGPRERVEL